MATLKEVRQIPLGDLVLSPQQVRTRDIEKDLDELVENFRVHGQLEPIIVWLRPGADGKYEVIAGQRRLLAAQQLGWSAISAAVFDGDIDDAKASVLSLSENLVRRGLNEKDLIDACTKLYRKYGSISGVSQELGLPLGRVRNYVKFDRLRPQLKAAVESGRLDVRAAIRIEDYFGERDISPVQLEQIVRDMAGMTNAQQVDYLESGGTEGGVARLRDAGAGSGKPPRPGAVAQVVVTLRSEDVGTLRCWAKAKGLTQDKAAAWIINRFFRHSPVEVGEGVAATGHLTVPNHQNSTARAQLG